MVNCSIQWQECRPEQYTGIKANRGRTHVSDHLAPGFVPFPVVSSLLFLLQHSLSGGTILQSKFTKNLTEAVDADLLDCICWVSQEQQKGMEPAHHIQKGLDIQPTLKLPYIIH